MRHHAKRPPKKGPGHWPFSPARVEIGAVRFGSHILIVRASQGGVDIPLASGIALAFGAEKNERSGCLAGFICVLPRLCLGEARGRGSREAEPEAIRGSWVWWALLPPAPAGR
jgi:hypothetical protein